ncbi:MAG: sigma-70 family RNA polymerase sigma factor [Angelakisella sp.]
MVTNEELVATVQAGDNDAVLILWGQVEKLVGMWARRWAWAWGDRTGTTAEDFMQAGYLGFDEALKTFDTERGILFTSWLTYPVKKEFSSLVGCRTVTRAKDGSSALIGPNSAMAGAVSLDAPLGSDLEDVTLGDAIADPTAPYTAVEQGIYSTQLHAAMHRALGTLPAEQRTTLERRYYGEQTVDAVAKEMGVYPSTVQQRELKALRTLRKDAALEQFVDSRTDFYRHVSLARFTSTGSSAVEEIVLKRERYRESHRRKLERGDAAVTYRKPTQAEHQKRASKILKGDLPTMTTNQLVIKECISTCFTVLGRYDNALAAYGAEKKKIDASLWNDEEKGRQRSKAQETAAGAAQRCYEDIAKELENIRNIAMTMESEFGITPELTAAITLVSSAGAKLTWETRRNLVKSFAGQKQALMALCSIFEAHDIETKEAKALVFDADSKCTGLDEAAYRLVVQPGSNLGVAYVFAKELEKFAELEGVELTSAFTSENEQEYFNARMRESMGLVPEL